MDELWTVRDASDSRPLFVRSRLFPRSPSLTARPGEHEADAVGARDGRGTGGSGQHHEERDRPRSAIIVRTEEKGSDVNLATLLVADAFKGNFEAAAVLSTDSDLTLPIELIRNELQLLRDKEWVPFLDLVEASRQELTKVAGEIAHDLRSSLRSGSST